MSHTTESPRTNTSDNKVHLIGRLSGRQARTLPSGDDVLTFRVIVDRPKRDRGPSGRVRVDALECSVWQASLARRIESWEEGDVIEVAGVLRRRFWRGGAGANSRIEVEVKTARRPR